METIAFHHAQIEIGQALHRVQEVGGGFDDLLDDIRGIAEGLPEGRIRRYLENWLASVGEPKQLRYDKLAAYWAGLWAADDMDVFDE